jgi:hypothetical protein
MLECQPNSKKNSDMDLRNDAGKFNFVLGLYSPFAKALTGGIVAMHFLAYKLAERGHNVYIFCNPEYPHENIHVIPSKSVFTEGFVEGYTWEGFNYPLHTTISILPQITRGNPFNTLHTARWILYDTEWELEKDYGPNDVYFNYGNFKTFKGVPENKLTVFNYNFDKLYQTNFGSRKGFCHIIHKHTPPNGEVIFNELKSFSLNNWKTNGAYDYLRQQFNQYEYFLTYDQKSFYTLAAGLCGCKSVILNPGPSFEFAPNALSESENYVNIMTPTEYRLNNPIQMFGVAYGWDDLNWANKTLEFVTNHLKELEKIDDKTVDGFIKYWEKKIFHT